MKKINFFLFLFFAFVCGLFSQENRIIYWCGFNEVISQDSTIKVLDFKNSLYDESFSFNNTYFERIPVSNRIVDVQISNVIYDELTNSELAQISTNDLTHDLKYNFHIGTEKKQNHVFFYLSPFIKTKTGVVKKVISFDLQLVENKITTISKKDYTSNSVLNSGKWYKIGVTKTGLHKIDANFLNSLGVDLSNVNMQNIRLFGNRAGVLDEKLVNIDIDDLSESAIEVIDINSSESFDSEDYILFFGQSPHVWNYDNTKFVYTKNIYSDTTYYFLSFDSDLIGKRMQMNSHDYELGNPDNNIITSSDKYFVYEEDNVNLVKTGRAWFGESFSFDLSQDFDTPIASWNADTILFSGNFAARSSTGSTFEINNGSFGIGSVYIPAIASSSNDYYKTNFIEQVFSNPNLSSDISLFFNNNGNGSALAWLDYFILQGRHEGYLDVNPASHYLFRDTQSVSEGAETCFQLSKSTNDVLYNVFDVTDPLNVTKQLYETFGLDGFFKTNTSSLKEFLVVSSNQNFTPSAIGLVENQNIHGAPQPSYIIVTHPLFINAATRLANFHSVNGEDVLLVTTEQIYNEFSTGSPDVSAIRNMVKMFYDRAGNAEEIPKNILLFGDASFDYKNKLDAISNYVPTYQSSISSSIQASYCTDDYYGALDDGEGGWNGGLDNSVNIDLIDIGIGRIPVTSINNAENFVDKILHYNSISSIGEWKNNICFVADDADANWEQNLIIHADALAEKMDTLYPHFNIKKIYIDSYQQSLSLGSQRYPDAQEDLINLIQDGALIVNYVGHGGEVGWASERILELSDINNFTNLDNLPVFITATCEFTRYDDPTRISAGEYLLLNELGGAIGLYSTSRTVQEGPTYNLVNALYNYLPDNNANYTFGEALYKSKNDPLAGFSSIKRRFSFFGDPNLKLTHPYFNVHTTSIELLDSLGQIHNNNPSPNDTIKSLSHVKISGTIIDMENNNVVHDFSGLLNMTVFDKPSLYNTLNNDGFLTQPFQYYLQDNIIYNGKVDVVDGVWSFEFIVPKDISYQYGEGKISYYAVDSIMGEASGIHSDVIIGGIDD